MQSIQPVESIYLYTVPISIQPYKLTNGARPLDGRRFNFFLVVIRGVWGKGGVGGWECFCFGLHPYQGIAWVLSTNFMAIGRQERKTSAGSLQRRSSWSYQDAIAPLQVVEGLWSFIEGELQVEPNMASHGYDDDDDFDIVDADGWNQYDSYAMRRAPQQPSIHMTQQMTTKVAPA